MAMSAEAKRCMWRDVKRRVLARKRGENVPHLKTGPKSEDVRGEANPNWKGSAATPAAGRTRARAKFRDLGPCAVCRDLKSTRHHIDRNTLNNAPSNIARLCHRCHMRLHGLERSAKVAVPVRCVETGEMFVSIVSAARAMRVVKSSIDQALKRGCRCRTFHWERIGG